MARRDALPWWGCRQPSLLGRSILRVQPARPKRLLSPGQFEPQIGSMIQPRDPPTLYGWHVQFRRRPPLDDTVKETRILVALK